MTANQSALIQHSYATLKFVYDIGSGILIKWMLLDRTCRASNPGLPLLNVAQSPQTRSIKLYFAMGT